jgi:O-antigen ligase
MNTPPLLERSPKWRPNYTARPVQQTVAEDERRRLPNEAPAPIGRARFSAALWIPFIWYFFVTTRSIAAWLGYGGAEDLRLDIDPASGSPIDRAVLSGLLALGGLILVSRWRALSQLLRRNKWIVALFLYMALSVAWSNFPDVSLRRFIRSLGTLVMVAVVLTERNPVGSVVALLRRTYYIHVPLSIISIKYFRDIGVHWSRDGLQEQWVGLSRHKNNLGQVAMSSGLFFSWRLSGALRTWRQRFVDFALVALSLWLLRGSGTSYSSTAVAGFLMGLGILFGLRLLRNRTEHVWRYAIAGTAAALCLAALFSLAVVAFNETPASVALRAAGRDATLTGRTLLWSDMLANASRQPLLGVGYGAFWVGPAGYDMYPLESWSKATPTWRPGQGHNGYLDVYVELGVVGLLLLCAVSIVALKDGISMLRTSYEAASIRLMLLASILFNNLTESSFLKGTHSLWFLFLLAAVTVPSLGSSPTTERSSS